MYKKYPNRVKSMAQYIKDTSDTPPAKVDNTQEEILRYIFAPDPQTGLPTSDLEKYANDNNPEIVDYIRRNLLQPAPHVAGCSDPDVVVALTRGADEDVISYADRVRAYVNENVNTNPEVSE